MKHEFVGRDPSALDAVVIGAGVAGLSCAIRLRELGCSVRLLEARPEQFYPCNTRHSGGVFHVAFRSMHAPPDVLARAVRDRTGGFVEPDLAEALAGRAAAAVEWMTSHGIEITSMQSPEDWKDCVVAPLGFHDGTRLVWRDLGADRMMQALEASLERLGGGIERGTRAVRLVMAGGVCTGVVALAGQHETEIMADAGVLADGGFQGSPELLARYVTRAPGALAQRGPGTSTGDGIRMAEAAGAELIGMESFYGHILSRDAEGYDRLCPFPFLDFLAEAGMLVDADGERFTDEGRAGVYMTNAVARHAGEKPVFAVFDENIWQEAGREFFTPPNPNLVAAGGTLHSASSIKELAGMIDISADVLEARVDAHNMALANDRLGDLTPTRTNPSGKARPIARPPFHAAPGRAAITHTMGGVRIDPHARACRSDGSPVLGLFAAGNTSGGFEGGPTIGYIGGLTRALVFGLIAAETIGD